ncbi:pilus assembly protein TadC [Litorivita pollutaquae]|uniref:Pilus assembly protein TadC n=1 Tax=Litorivita pollutaquae TaxID=2200892 RepID=A0A2V4NT48_9RHOB|nr:type II secretion system F family protein [Litorivita pollutaquae]PYC48046.1 pilus assembly protein TadC [Litorivita pollutaquae]
MNILAPIQELLVAQFGEFGPLLAVGFLGLVMIIVTLPVMLNKKADPLDRLKASRTLSKSAKDNDRLRTDTRNQKLDRYASFLEPSSEEEYSAARLKLIRAGYRTKDAVRYFHFAQFALGLGFLAAGVIYYIVNLSGGETSTQKMAMYILGPGGVGYMLPKYWVTKRVQTRQEEITNGFPDALDMMLVCVEAGQSLDQSINRVAGELRASYPALSEEFQIVAHEMKAGKDKVNVLGDMSERCGVQDVASFVTVLVQSATFGTSISDALRVYAGEMRDKRVMRAEEAANKLPTKMTLATMMFTVPPLLIILVGPSVQGITQMGNMGGLH